MANKKKAAKPSRKALSTAKTSVRNEENILAEYTPGTAMYEHHRRILEQRQERLRRLRDAS